MAWWWTGLVLPAAGALAAGAAIGFEREYSGRSAGLRTHALLSLGCALLMIMALHQQVWMAATATNFDPLRVVQAVLTGIGFLGGGVIFREGFSVHGLTTAASIWIVAALGLVFGAGFYPLAIGGTLAVLVILNSAKMVEAILPREQISDLTVRYRRADAPSDAEFDALARAHGSRVTHMAYRLVDGAALERVAVLKTRGRLIAEPLVRALAGDDRVLQFTLDPRND